MDEENDNAREVEATVPSNDEDEDAMSGVLPVYNTEKDRGTTFTAALDDREENESVSPDGTLGDFESIPDKTDQKGITGSLGVIGGTFISVVTPVWTLYLLAIVSYSVQTEFGRNFDSFGMFLFGYLIFFPLVSLTIFLLMILEIAARTWIHSRLMEHNVILDFENRSPFKAVVFILWLLASAVFFLIFSTRAAGYVGVLITILLQTFSLFQVYKNKFNRLERTTITLNQFVEIEPKTSASRLSKYRLVEEKDFSYYIKTVSTLSEYRRSMESVKVSPESNFSAKDSTPVLGIVGGIDDFSTEINWAQIPDQIDKLPVEYRTEHGPFVKFFADRSFGLRALMLNRSRLYYEEDRKIGKLLWIVAFLAFVLVLSMNIYGFVLLAQDFTTEPRNFRVSSVTANTATLSWIKPTKEMNNFLVNYVRTDGTNNLDDLLTRNSTDSSVLLTDLSTGSLYSASIAGQFVEGFVLPVSEAFFFETSGGTFCSSRTTCATCIAEPACGWCSGTNVCSAGSARGDSSLSCQPPSWRISGPC